MDLELARMTEERTSNRRMRRMSVWHYRWLVWRVIPTRHEGTTPTPGFSPLLTFAESVVRALVGFIESINAP